MDDRRLSNAANVTLGSSMLRNLKVILVATLIGAAGGFLLGLTREGRGGSYVAEAVVAASSSPLLAENFADLGIALFRTDTVLQPVIDELDLNIDSQSLLTEGFLKVESVSNAVALRINAQNSDPDLAADLANAAADSFASALASNEMGDFAIFEDNQVSQKPGQSPLQLTLLTAAVGGFLGAAVLLLRNVIIQPIFTKDEALSVYPADVAFSARVYMDRALSFRRRAANRSWEVSPHGVTPAIRRSTAVRQGSDSYSSCYVLVGRNRRRDRAVRALMEDLRSVDEPEQRESSRTRDLNWIQVTDRRLGETVQEAAVVVAVISQGVSRRSLELLTEELLVAPGRRLLILVLVASARRMAAVRRVNATLRQLIPRRRSSPRRQFSSSRSGGA